MENSGFPGFLGNLNGLAFLFSLQHSTMGGRVLPGVFQASLPPAVRLCVSGQRTR